MSSVFESLVDFSYDVLKQVRLGIGAEARHNGRLCDRALRIIETFDPSLAIVKCALDHGMRYRRQLCAAVFFHRFKNHVGKEERQLLNLRIALACQLDDEIAQLGLSCKKSLELRGHLLF